MIKWSSSAVINITNIGFSWLDGEEVHNEDEEAMMKMMGFSNFDSTKVIIT